jgi:hypothetical protein
MRNQPIKIFASAAIIVAAALALVGGCSDSRLDPLQGSSGTSGTTPTSCSVPGPGCPCATEGELASCGKVTQRIGDYVTCSNGLTECKGGRFGACEGDQVVTKRVPTASQLRTLGLGVPATCANPCSPACATITDTPIGLDAGVDSGFSVTDAGLQLTPVSQIPDTCTSMTISPTTAPTKDVVISGPGPWTVQFTATLAPAGCYTGAFQPLWSVDKFDVADVSTTGKLSLVSPVSGELKIVAIAGALISNVVTTKVTVNRTTTSVPDSPPATITPASFPTITGATPADNVTVIYPYEGTMLPLGLPAPLLQWQTPTAADGVKVTLRYPPTGPAIYDSSELRREKITFPVPLRAAKERATIPQADWVAFEQTINRNRATSGDTGALVIRRVVAGVARQETVRLVKFAPTQLKGRIYYNTYGTALVSNYGGALQSAGGAFVGNQFGAATLQVVMGDSAPTVVAGTSGQCIVCHSASADGQLLISAWSNYNNYKFALPGAPPTGTYLGDTKFVFPGIHPNKTRIYTSAGGHSGYGNSQLYDANGTLLGGTRPSNIGAAYPAFTHNSTGAGKVAFSFMGGSPSPLPNPPSGPTTGDQKTLSMMDFDGNTNFSNFRNVYTDPFGRRAWWPAFLPSTDNGLVFHLERRSNGRDPGGTRSDCECSNRLSGTTAEIWWASTGATPNARRLDALNGYNPDGTTGSLPTGPTMHGGPGSDPNYFEQAYNYEPTVLPVIRGGFSWVTFTSRRLYGNVATINPYNSDPRYADISIDPTTKKLWISALKENPVPGTDPSYPAFYVPGQELISGNMRGYFVLDACRNPGPKVPANECDTDLDCCAGSICALDRPITNPAKRYCVSGTPGVCKADGASCTADAECCNFSVGVRCGSGVCAYPPPIYNSAPFEREYTASCGAGKRVEWSLYQWKSDIPAGTSITFQAQTRATTTDPWGPFVNIGTSSTTATAWTSGPQTVAQAFTAAGQPSGYPLVNVRASFNIGSPPNFTPVLKEWRLGFDCLANE